MADQDLLEKPFINQVAIGVDESTQEFEPGPEWDSVSGVFPGLHEIHAIGEQQVQIPEQGALQRINGKKLIDANSNQKVFAICQAFNGFGQFAYFVQTNQKLYLHICESPKDLHISFAMLQTLGIDSNGLSLDIFGHQPSSTQAIPDPKISCVFDFPSGDKPTPPNAAHPGVDYLVITLTPVSSTDYRLRTRLTSLNSTTPYDNQDIGFYKTQNACRQDSVPLVDGTDGEVGYPPSTSRTAYLGWGGNIWKNSWSTHTSASPNIWTQVASAWVQVNPPTFSYPYRGYVSSHLGGGPFYSPFGGYNYSLGGVSPGQRIFYDNRNDNRGIDTGTNWWTVTNTLHNGQYMLQATSGPAISFPQNSFPTATNSGRYGLIGTTVYQDVKYNEDSIASWQEPKSASYGTSYLWANAATREADAASNSSGNVNKIGFESSSTTYWKLTKFSSYQYASFATMQNSSHVASDRLKYARETDNNSWWQLTQVGVAVVVTWTYANANDRINASGFAPADINKVARQLDNDTYWQLDDYNRHTDNSLLSESYFINLNRLFTDYQTITPTTLQFMVRAYWDKVKNGTGQVQIAISSYRGGLLARSDSVLWGLTSGIFVQTQTTTKTCNLVAIDGDVKGDNLVQITVTMADGTINLTTPTPNGDGATPCSF